MKTLFNFTRNSIALALSVGVSFGCNFNDNKLYGSLPSSSPLKIMTNPGDSGTSVSSYQFKASKTSVTFYSVFQGNSEDAPQNVRATWSINDTSKATLNVASDNKSASLDGLTKGTTTLSVTYDSYEVNIPIEVLEQPHLDLSKTTVTVESSQMVNNTTIPVTIYLKDQYGEAFVDSSGLNFDFSHAGGVTQGWFSNLVDNSDGTYSVDFFAETAGSATGLQVTIDGNPVTSTLPQVAATNHRLKWTGGADPSTNYSNRLFDETDGALTLTGECDPQLGDVTFLGYSNTFSPLRPTVTCQGDGTFSFEINYDTTEPYLNSSQGPSFIKAYQSTVPPIYTTVHKTQSGNPPQLITDRTGLTNIACADATAYYILTADIDLGPGGSWTPLCSGADDFMGMIDGNGHTISNLTINSGGWGGTSSRALISFAGGSSVIMNLNVDTASVTQGAGSESAALVARSTGTRFINITMDNVTINGLSEVGAVVGDTGGGDLILISLTNSDIDGDSYVGGLAGKLTSGSIRIERAYVSSTSVTGTGDYVGGVVGDSDAYIEESFVESTVSGNDLVGGFCGQMNGSLLNSYFKGSVSGGNNIGGFGGQSLFAQVIKSSILYTSSITHTGVANYFVTGSFGTDLSSEPPLYSSSSICTSCSSIYSSRARTPAELLAPMNYQNPEILKTTLQIDGGTFKSRWIP